MAKSKRKIAFENVCDYCGKSFKTSMPFAKFCSDNHRKYFAYRKSMYEKVIHKKSIEESDNLIRELLVIGANKNANIDELIEKITKAAKKLEAHKKIKDNIDGYVKEFIKKDVKHKKNLKNK